MAVSEGDALGIAAAGDGEEDEFGFGDAEPDGGFAPPAATVDAGIGSQQQLWLGSGSEFG